MKKRIFLSLLALALCSAFGVVLALISIRDTTSELSRLIRLHQIEGVRQNLLKSIQTTLSDLYTVNTPLSHSLDSIVGHVSEFDHAAQRCTSCHHDPELTQRLKGMQSLVMDYKDALSFYITASADFDRIDRLKLEAAMIGNKILLSSDEMSVQASKKLEAMTDLAMKRIARVKAILKVSLLLTFVLGTLIAVRLTLFVTRPTRELVTATRAIATGDLGYRVGYDGADEFGEIARNFNAMSAALRSGYEKLQLEVIERREAETALAKSDAFLNTIFDSIGDPFCIVDKELRIVKANEAYADLKKTVTDDLIGKTCHELLNGRESACGDCIVARVFLSGDPCAKEIAVASTDGSEEWMEIHTYPIFGNDGKVSHVIEYTRDITGRKMAEEALRESKERYELAARGANDGLWDWDLRTGKVFYSPRWRDMLGLREEDACNCPDDWFGRVHPDDVRHLEAKIAAHLDGNTSHFEHEYRILHVDGQYRWMLTRGLAVRDASRKAYRIAGSQTDISERKRAEEQLLHDALHDSLTGLPNRMLFMDRLQHRLLQLAKSPYRPGNSLTAVLFLDMDRFKVINDSLGHLLGDQLLIAVSKRLISTLRPGDTVARLGGDEFAVLLSDIRGVSDAALVAERVLAEFQQPFLLRGNEVFTSASIGISLSVNGLERPEELIRDADIAMYQAKALGKSRYEIFDASMHASTVARLQIETDLRKALENAEFLLHYQPIMDLRSNRVVGLETLIRWRHPRRGLIQPAEFIPVAEEAGMISPIGAWILKESCRQLKDWHRNFPLDPPLRISVNVSSKQFAQTDLPERIADILKENELSGDCLALEITESTLMDSADSAREMLIRLREMGIHIHLDDFGTGYSSLSYLHRFPITALKIDRSFISKMSLKDENLEIVKAIISLANTLRIDLIAEGLEVSDQLVRLREMNCAYGQGFLFSRPLAAADVETLLAADALAALASGRSGNPPADSLRGAP